MQRTTCIEVRSHTSEGVGSSMRFWGRNNFLGVTQLGRISLSGTPKGWDNIAWGGNPRIRLVTHLGWKPQDSTRCRISLRTWGFHPRLCYPTPSGFRSELPNCVTPNWIEERWRNSFARDHRESREVISASVLNYPGPASCATPNPVPVRSATASVPPPLVRPSPMPTHRRS